MSLALNKLRVKAIAWKDSLEFLRDRKSIVLMIVSAFLFPFLGVFTTGLKSHQQVLVVLKLCDNGSYAHDFAKLLSKIIRQYSPYNLTVIDTGDCSPPQGATVTIVLPRGFTHNMSLLDGVAVVKVYEVAGSAAAEEVKSLVYLALKDYARRIIRERVSLLAGEAGVSVDVEALLNPLRLVSKSVTPSGTPLSPEVSEKASIARFLAFSVFFVLNPTAIAIADNVARERESGTGEILVTTPVTGLEFVLGKIAGSLTALLLAGILDLAAALVYGVFSVSFTNYTELALFHMIQTLLAILATMSITMLVSLYVTSQRAATLSTSLVTGMAIMVFFTALFVDIGSLPLSIKLPLYLIPYTHIALAIEAFALGEVNKSIMYSCVPLILTLASLTAAVKSYSPERLVKH